MNKNNSRTDQVSILLSRHILDVWEKELKVYVAEDVNRHIRPIFDFEFEKVEQFAKFVAQELKAQWNISLAKETVESISKVVFNFMIVNFKPNDCGIKFKVAIPKPPLGIIPKNLWKEARIHDLAECLALHKEKPDDKFLEWAKELYELVDDLRFDEKIK